MKAKRRVLGWFSCTRIAALLDDTPAVSKGSSDVYVHVRERERVGVREQIAYVRLFLSLLKHQCQKKN